MRGRRCVSRARQWGDLAAALAQRCQIGARRRLPARLDPADAAAAAILLVGLSLAWLNSDARRWAGLIPVLTIALVGGLALLGKSLLDFTRTGPSIPADVMRGYRWFTVLALLRLTAWAVAVLAYNAGIGVLGYWCLTLTLRLAWSFDAVILAGVLGVLGALGLQFLRTLRFNPGLIVASMHYRSSRLYQLWRLATPARVRALGWGVAGLLLGALGGAVWRLATAARWPDLIALLAVSICLLAVWRASTRTPLRRARRIAQPPDPLPPNIVMIGSDTLRADRLGAFGYRRKLTPHIDRLGAAGACFAQCYVPCARTAPSLISMLTGTWPHKHGVRDNFVSDEATTLTVDALPQLLAQRGYFSAAVSDWCGADLAKFSFGFDLLDLPEDQWNLKYLIRQGPKDLRLFLSLFLHNRLGRRILPELYYLGGVPLTTSVGVRARNLLTRLADTAQPFFLNVFYSTTHPPFASEWPHYTRFADPGNQGESKFAMALLTDPFEIIRRQGAPKEEFDLDQIIDLYDGCVAQFDDEVGKMLAHVEACGLRENTLIVVYSDHGTEFFEHDTWGQGNSAVGEASPRVPLVIHDPRIPSVGRIDAVVRSIDLAPTLLELVGAPIPAGMDGVSLAACLTLGGSCPNLDAFNETGIWITPIPGLPETHLRYPDLTELIEVPDPKRGTLAVKPAYVAQILAAKDRMIRRGRWKLVYQPLQIGHRLCLFDLEHDPACQHDLATAHPDRCAELWAALQCWLRQDPKYVPRGDGPATPLAEPG